MNRFTATWISSTRILCTFLLKSRSSGNTSISMSNNGVEFSEVKPVVVKFVDAVVHEIPPSSGPSQSETLISVMGIGFDILQKWMCRTSIRQVQLVHTSSTLLLCKVPVLPSSPGRHLIQIGHSEMILKEHERSIRTPPVITRITPDAGSERGGTIVRVEGGFLNGRVVECMFAAVPTKSVAVTSSMLLCVSPPFFQSVPFSVRVDGVQGETRTFSHVPILVLQSVVPNVTFYSGNNRIQLFGFDFKDLTTLLCRLGDTFTTPAYYHSSQRVSCLVPSFGIRNISVAIANNGFDFSSSFDLEVIQAPSIASIYPSSGPSQGVILVRLLVRDLKPMLRIF